MSYKILEHTGDLAILVTGSTIKDLFLESVRAMMEILKPKLAKKKKQSRRKISITARGETDLLIDFLNETLALTQIYKEIYVKIVIDQISATSIKARFLGLPVMEFGDDIKAVTYHSANVHQNQKGEWETNLLFDI